MDDRSALGAAWPKAGLLLGVEVLAPFSLVCPDGSRITAAALVKGFGASEGMLLLTDYAEVRDRTDLVQKLGYGFSVLSEPAASEPFESESYIEVLEDWGWAGAEEERPTWLRRG